MSEFGFSNFLTQFGFSILFPVMTLIIGGIWGRIGQQRHFSQMDKAEESLSDIMLFNSKPKNILDAREATLVQGNVVMSIDYFRFFLGSWRNMLGGKVSTFQINLERGRREAIIRMRQMAKDMGADCVYNIKVESMAVGAGRGVEVLAYGTAVKYETKYES